MKSVLWKLVCSAAILACAVPACAAAATFSMETATPSGFEDLTEPTPLVVDIYYGGRLLSENQKAMVSPSTITFQNPEQILQLLPETSQPSNVLQRLKQTLTSNSHLACRNYNRDRCGVVPAEVLEVIYDSDLFRVDIFIGADYLTPNAVMEDPYLPPASNRFAVSQQFSGNWSGSQSSSNSNRLDTQSYTLYSDSIVSFGESSVRGSWSYSDNPNFADSQSQLQISDLFWTRDYRGKAVSVGLFRPMGNSSRFTGFGSLYGVEFYRSDNTRLDGNLSSGTPIEVHMPVRGRIEVYREERLIHSEMLEAGNQLISTTSFPSGAYDIRVVTYSEQGRALDEFEQFFAKDSRLPPAGEWQWNLMAGAPAESSLNQQIPELSEQVLVQAGLGRRLADNFGLFGGVTAAEEAQVFELGGRWVTPYFEVTPELVATSSGNTGARINFTLRSQWATLNYQEARIDNPERADTSNLLISTNNFRTASLNVPVGRGRFNARYTERDLGVAIDDPQLLLPDRALTGNRLQTLEFHHPILRNRHWNGDFRLGYSESDAAELWSMSFQFRYNTGHWNNNSYIRAESNAFDEDRYFAGVSSNWNDGDLWPAEVQQQLNLEGSKDSSVLRSLTRISGRRGSLTSNINYLSEVTDTLSYTGGFNTTFASDGDYFSWGGESSYNTSVLVDIDGAEEDNFEVLVNGSRRGYAKGGEQSLISVPSFESYEISVKPLGDGFYDYLDSTEIVTVYPGNMASTQYEIKTLVLVLGKLVRDEKPVAGATFRIGDQKTKTDDNGIFQLEYYAAPGKRNFTYIIWNDCEVPLEKLLGDRSWLNLGTIDLNKASCDFDQEGQPLASTH
ncbi:TcfC E-set like domain-containing protein [Microbulbifer agarilyticus]|uniref:TcfC E-set like domain-containing protein n=1 Tax=Microbulbifer agarilyticus TaxID=260552 RepID=UPI001C98260B|nr:TcfC E-set like domain-containing protein [Microbulbifer agarilyticus]MBY6190496.1 TcfC E-set like domain-containing protein [Microbulbifer agarilyticus]